MSPRPSSVVTLTPKECTLLEPLVAPERRAALDNWVNEQTTLDNIDLRAHVKHALEPLLAYDLATIATNVNIQLKAARNPAAQTGLRLHEKERQHDRNDSDKLFARLFSPELKDAKQFTSTLDEQVRTLICALAEFKPLALDPNGKQYSLEERTVEEARVFVESLTTALERAGMDHVTVKRLDGHIYGLHAPDAALLTPQQAVSPAMGVART